MSEHGRLHPLDNNANKAVDGADHRFSTAAYSEFCERVQSAMTCQSTSLARLVRKKSTTRFHTLANDGTQTRNVRSRRRNRAPDHAARCHLSDWQSRFGPAFNATPSRCARKLECVEQIADRGRIDGHIRMRLQLDRIRQIVTASVRDRLQMPVAFDEFHDQRVI